MAISNVPKINQSIKHQDDIYKQDHMLLWILLVYLTKTEIKTAFINWEPVGAKITVNNQM